MVFLQLTWSAIDREALSLKPAAMISELFDISAFQYQCIKICLSFATCKESFRGKVFALLRDRGAITDFYKP